MRNTIIKMIVGVLLLSSTTIAFAGTHTLFAGYANIKPKGGDALHGIRLTDLYEIDNEWGVITSLAYGSRAQHIDKQSDNYLKAENKYSSLMIGPAYRLTHRFSVYGQIGMATMQNSLTPTDKQFKDYHLIYDNSSLGLGVGVIVNPIEHMAISAGFETSRFQPAPGNDKGKISYNSFNLNVGYRF